MHYFKLFIFAKLPLDLCYKDALIIRWNFPGEKLPCSLFYKIVLFYLIKGLWSLWVKPQLPVQRVHLCLGSCSVPEISIAQLFTQPDHKVGKERESLLVPLKVLHNSKTPWEILSTLLQALWRHYILRGHNFCSPYSVLHPLPFLFPKPHLPQATSRTPVSHDIATWVVVPIGQFLNPVSYLVAPIVESIVD